MGAVGLGAGIGVWIGVFEVVEGRKIGSDGKVVPRRLAPALPRAMAIIIMAAKTFIIAFCETNIFTVLASPQFSYYFSFIHQ